MKIFTSYFGNKKIPNNLVKIAICLYPPKGFDGLLFQKISPNFEILDDWKNGKKDEEAKGAYERAYRRKILRKLNASEILLELERLSGGKDIVLLCYEKSKDFCHRHLFSKWIKEELDIDIFEI